MALLYIEKCPLLGSYFLYECLFKKGSTAEHTAYLQHIQRLEEVEVILSKADLYLLKFHLILILVELVLTSLYHLHIKKTKTEQGIR